MYGSVILKATVFLPDFDGFDEIFATKIFIKKSIYICVRVSNRCEKNCFKKTSEKHRLKNDKKLLACDWTSKCFEMTKRNEYGRNLVDTVSMANGNKLNIFVTFYTRAYQREKANIINLRFNITALLCFHRIYCVYIIYTQANESFQIMILIKLPLKLMYVIIT